MNEIDRKVQETSSARRKDGPGPLKAVWASVSLNRFHLKRTEVITVKTKTIGEIKRESDRSAK